MNEEEFLRDLPVINLSKLKRKRSIGSGGYGKVYLYEMVAENGDIKEVAVKAVNITTDPNFSKMESLRNEAVILNSIAHEFVLKYHNSFSDDHLRGIVVEYHKYGSLKSFLLDISPSTTMNESELVTSWRKSLKKQFASEISEGMCFLHQKSILHLDLNVVNILVSNELHVQISDFGCAVKSGATDHFRMSYAYAAPERISAKDGFIPTSKCDVYSFGILCWAMMTEMTPYHDGFHVRPDSNDPKEFYMRHVVNDDKRLPIDSINDKDVSSMIQTCWVKSSANRPSSSELSKTLEFKMSLDHFHEAKEVIECDYEAPSEELTCSSARTSILPPNSLCSSSHKHSAHSCLNSERNKRHPVDNPENQTPHHESDETRPLLGSDNNQLQNKRRSVSRKCKVLIIVVVLGVALVIATILLLKNFLWKPEDKKDLPCTTQGGRCENYFLQLCAAGYETGLCDGDENRRCCLECDHSCMADEAKWRKCCDAECTSSGRTCQLISNYCTGQYTRGICGGPNERQCCNSTSGSSDFGCFGNILKVNTTGASNVTASQDRLPYIGVNASREMAGKDIWRMGTYKVFIEQVGSQLCLDPSIIAGIISRGTRAGKLLRADGFGYNGHDFGLMQIDVRYFTLEGGPYSYEHILQGSGILLDMIQGVQNNHKTWTKEMLLKGGVCAYNSGIANVKTYDHMDVGTTGGDFSNDVTARSQYYKDNGY